jgi:hypothetical protein
MLALRFDPWWLRISLAALTVVGFTVVAIKLRRRAGRPTDTQLTIVGDAGGEVSGYLAAYLLPFLTVAEPDARDLAAYALFVLVAGVIYTRSSLVHINPTMYALRWRPMRASIVVADGQSKDVYVLTRSDPRTAQTLRGERLSDRVWIDRDQRS